MRISFPLKLLADYFKPISSAVSSTLHSTERAHIDNPRRMGVLIEKTRIQNLIGMRDNGSDLFTAKNGMRGRLLRIKLR